MFKAMIALGFIAAFFWIHVHIVNYNFLQSRSDFTGNNKVDAADRAAVNWMEWFNKTWTMDKIGEGSGGTDYQEASGRASIFELRRKVLQSNSALASDQILNADMFRRFRISEDLIIMVQVHDRYQYLAALIDSLQRVRGIEDALLIFSHDIYDDRMNSMIKRITFCKVSFSHSCFFMLIAMQIHAHTDLYACAR